MPTRTDDRTHLSDFIRLDEAWITEHFALEAAVAPYRRHGFTTPA